MIESCVALGLLGVCSVEDIRKREIGVYKIFLVGIAGVFLHIFREKIGIYNLLAGMSIGLVLLLLGKVFKGSIGSGDGLILMDTGILLGLERNLELFLNGLLLAGVWALILWVFFRKKKEYEIPFIPFLLISYVGMLV